MQTMKANHEANFAKLNYVVPDKALQAAVEQVIHIGDNYALTVPINLTNCPNTTINNTFTVGNKSAPGVPEEKVEVSIIDEMFQAVLVKIKANPSPKPPVEPSLSLTDKIQLNFTDAKEQEEVVRYIQTALLKMSIIEGTFKALGNEEQNDITAHIFQRYNERKRKGLQNIQILTELFSEFTPAGKQSDPAYTNLARALVLFFFDDCTIFEKTTKEKSKGGS